MRTGRIVGVDGEERGAGQLGAEEDEEGHPVERVAEAQRLRYRLRGQRHRAGAQQPASTEQPAAACRPEPERTSERSALFRHLCWWAVERFC